MSAAELNWQPTDFDHTFQRLRQVGVTGHAIRRYQQRVELVPWTIAGESLALMAREAQRLTTPRSWSPLRPVPGTLFLYPPTRPDVCLLLRYGMIITVFSRQFFQQQQSLAEKLAEAGVGRGAVKPSRRPSRHARTHFDNHRSGN